MHEPNFPWHIVETQRYLARFTGPAVRFTVANVFLLFMLVSRDKNCFIYDSVLISLLSRLIFTHRTISYRLVALVQFEIGQVLSIPIWQYFELYFPKNEASYRKILFYIFNLFFSYRIVSLSIVTSILGHPVYLGRGDVEMKENSGSDSCERS